MSDPSQRIVEAIHRIVLTIQNVSDMPSLLKEIMAESKGLLNAEASSLFLYDEVQNDLYFEIVLGESEEDIKSIRVPMGEGFVGTAAVERKTIIINNVASDPRHFKKMDDSSGFVTRNVISVPMVRNDRLIGVLQVLNHAGTEDFNDLDARILEIMAAQAAATIENARLIEDNIKTERLVAMGAAVGGLAHHIKNILTRLMGSSSLIDNGLKNGDTDLINQAWPILKRATTNISDLVQDMLYVSKDREPDYQSLEINQMIEEIIGDCREGAGKHDIVLKADLDASIPIAQIDRKRMHDALLNIVGNAIDALAESGAIDGCVRVTSRLIAEGERIAIDIIDDGPGIPPEIIPKLFDLMFSTKGSKGTGFGLFVVQKVLKEHGGSIRVDSTLGKGTTFSLEIPIVPPASDA